MPTTMEAGPTRCSTRVSRKPPLYHPRGTIRASVVKSTLSLDQHVEIVKGWHLGLYRLPVVRRNVFLPDLTFYIRNLHDNGKSIAATLGFKYMFIPVKLFE